MKCIPHLATPVVSSERSSRHGDVSNPLSSSNFAKALNLSVTKFAASVHMRVQFATAELHAPLSMIMRCATRERCPISEQCECKLDVPTQITERLHFDVVPCREPVKILKLAKFGCAVTDNTSTFGSLPRTSMRPTYRPH